MLPSRRLVIFMSLAMSMVLCGYFTFIRHPPPEDILKRNLEADRIRQNLVGHALHSENYDPESPAVQSREHWENWIKANSYVSIGEVYDKCEGEDKIMLGKTIMLQDPRGGIKGRFNMNTTWDHDIEEGEINLDVKYNGKDLVKLKFDLCTLDAKEEVRILVCPLKEGPSIWKKDLKIPNLLPLGRYQTKSWVTDQDQKVILCGFSDFTL